MSSNADRREFQRLELRIPAAGKLGDADALVVDLGILGARVELMSPVPQGSTATLRFMCEGEDLSFDCDVVHLEPAGVMTAAPFQAGVVFSHPLNGSEERLRRVLMALVSREIGANRPDPALVTGPVFDPDETAMRITAPFIVFRYEGGTWRRRPVFIPEQPLSGFTIPSRYDRDELQQLCFSYEIADGEGRRLIRLFAELHVCRALGVPPVHP